MKEQLLKIASKTRLYNVKTYLEFTGWADVKSVLKSGVLFRRTEPKEGQEFDELIVPESEEVHGYPYAILNIAERLSRFDKRPVMNVLLDLQNPLMDKISYRIISPNADFGSIGMDGVEKFFGGILSAVKSAVIDVVRPSVFHKQLRGKEIDQLLKSARFGQTEVGSFVVNLYIPVGLESDQMALVGMEDRQFRRGMEHLMKAVQMACSSISTGNVREFVMQNQKDAILSSNVLAAILETKLWDDAEIEISASWSPVVPVSDGVPSKVYLKKEVFPVFNQWVGSFRPKPAEYKKQEFRGQVVELSGDEHDDDGNTYGEVLIAVVSNVGEPFNAKVFLESVEEYQIAIESHAKNKFVKFQGDATREYGRGKIDNIEKFSLDES